ncbi:MAG: YrhK family protein [Ilumatobacter sp.]|uniref:YrhK family protein n=1 Tax=Ilumatobacter sp. TaxID=1967498 RepID=UPI00260C67F9|nr:YrhK family protein [Ilumatobacter sp.]MDJ0770394.1 YrhK family protein [Ilumatobacter sp.]
MMRLAGPWMLVVASLLFLMGSLSFLDDDRYTLGAWLFVAGSALFLAHSIAGAFDRSSG